MIKIAFTSSTDKFESKSDSKIFLRPRYINSIMQCAENAGIHDIMPVILPVTKSESAIEACALEFDGFVFTGGDDIDPKLYGEPQIKECGAIEAERDIFELSLLQRLIRLKKPVLGICRGIQIMNVALGGTLWQDIVSQYSPVCVSAMPYAHCQTVGNGIPSHKVEVSGFLRRILGCETINTNSYHHQSVKTLGDGLIQAAKSGDGLTEALEHETLPFYKAVQWHPEINPDWVSQRLFESFISAIRS